METDGLLASQGKRQALCGSPV